MRKNLKRKHLSRGECRDWPLGLLGASFVPEWKLLVHTPAVFVGVANKGLTGYGTWKCVRKMGDG